jgi:hypothetical protein
MKLIFFPCCVNSAILIVFSSGMFMNNFFNPLNFISPKNKLFFEVILNPPLSFLFITEAKVSLEITARSSSDSFKKLTVIFFPVLKRSHVN